MASNATGYANVIGNVNLGETLTLSLVSLPDETTSMNNSQFVRYLYEEVAPKLTATIQSANPDYWSENFFFFNLEGGEKSRLDLAEIMIQTNEPGESLYTGGRLTSVTEADGFADVISYAWYADDELISSGKTLLITESLLGKSLSGAISYNDDAGNLEIVYSQSLGEALTPSYELVLTGGNDFLMGTNGLDSLDIPGNRENFSVSREGSVVSLVDLSGGGGTDSLSSIERLRFNNDKGLAFDIDGPNSAGGIYRLYQAAFSRTPDKPGLGFWIGQADSGMGAIEMGERFVWAGEFEDLYEVTTRDNYLSGYDINSVITGFYENVLGRTPDQGGLNFYVSAISLRQKTVGQVLAEIADSPENYAATVGQIQNGIEYWGWV